MATSDMRNRVTAAAAGNYFVSNPVGTLDPVQDLKWSKPGKAPRTPHTYFDYVFTGQDVMVYIDGMDINEACIPIIEFGFNIQQQKVPVYGFWSHAYDNVMRGTRLISGVIRIATESTQYMTNKISEAATERAKKRSNLNPIRGLDMDETNIEKYWGRNRDPDVFFNNGKHLFSAHPPFNLVCAFGMQSISVGPSPLNIAPELYEKYRYSDPMLQNINERLVETDQDGTMAYILENVELTSMETEFTPTGEVIAESYSFFARDLRTPKEA